MRTIGIFSSIVIVISFIYGCGEKPSRFAGKAPIPQETFIQLYVDILIAGESGKLSKVDSSHTPPRSAVLDSIYNKYGVTEVQVQQTINEYSKDLRRWKEFYDEAIKRLETLQKEEQKKKQS